MMQRLARHLFTPPSPSRPTFGRSDLLLLLLVIALLALGLWAARTAPSTVTGPTISLAPAALPWYALLSLGRMTAAYALSLLFTLVYGYVAAYSPRAERVMMPLLDVLQSVPILSFLPVVLLSFTAVLPEDVAVELAAIVLIFTSQVWNMTFAWYQSLTTIPKELREASRIFRFDRWRQLKTLELPFGANALIWNSMMSWAGGWFFLMAAEIFTLGERDYRLPGLGAYLQTAGEAGDLLAIGLGMATLVVLIIGVDQLVWRPLLAWADRFKVEFTESAAPPSSWFYAVLQRAQVDNWLLDRLAPLGRGADVMLSRALPPLDTTGRAERRSVAALLAGLVVAGVLLAGAFAAGQLLLQVTSDQWLAIGAGLLATLLRVAVALALALLWTVPLGVVIGTNRRVAAVLQPVVQLIASVPATALFPLLLLALLTAPGGLNIAAVLLMLLGTQWYVLFNVIAGASAIPQDLQYTSALLQLRGWTRWRTLVLPALFADLITGMITASGGAWNASIVAEYVVFGGQTYAVTGVGTEIAQATAAGDYPLLLAATLGMIVAVVVLNRVVWRRLYRLAESTYRLE
jgi:NitT/TauT family transport system permease protein